MKSDFAVLVGLMLLVFPPCKGGGLMTWLFPLHKVRIENGLSGNQILGVHCQTTSGLDMKLQELPPLGAFSFSFERHPFGPGRVLCLLWNDKAYFEFEVLDSNLQFQGFCGSSTCIYTAKDDAIYRYKGGKVLKYYADWTGITPEQEFLTRSNCKALFLEEEQNKERKRLGKT